MDLSSTFHVFFMFLMFLMLYNVAFAKECTNIPTELSSHSLRYQLQVSTNQTWKDEMFSHYHLTPTDTSAWASLLPRKIFKEEHRDSWMMLYRNIKNPGNSKVAGEFLKEVPLDNVRLDPSSIHGQAQQTNLEYLLLLDVDSLVWSFRKNAGLPTPGDAYGGWEAPNVELRGHFVGHYLSATAQMWSATHNDTLKEKMSAVISALSDCQEKMGTGYLSAFPSEQFDRFEAVKPVWAPYYTIHKIMAGLLDQYLFGKSAQALKMVTWMAQYFYDRVQNVILKYTIEQHYRSLNEETGGMNDVLYNLYSVTGDPKHLLLAHLFDKPCFLGLLAVQADDISGFHANTHIPIVIGSQRRYEVTGDPLYKEIGKFFMDVVNTSHSYATGGTSVSEFWSEPKRLASTLQTENEESCTTYNMLKVSRHLFKWTKDMSYADYYERALTNGVLSIQRGREPGVMIYMLPLGHGQSKARSYHGWGTKFDSFWCCYGTGIESFSKLGDSIYFEEEGDVPGIYIIQYISSSLDWNSGKISLAQKVEPVNSWDNRLHVKLSILSKEGSGRKSTLKLRIPPWTYSNGAKAALNGQELSLPDPGNFLQISRQWNINDEIAIELPISIRTEAIKDDRAAYASDSAILYGPYLLVGLSSGDREIKTENSVSDWISPIPAEYNSHLITLSHESTNTVIAKSDKSLRMETTPESGSNHSIHATFRIIPKELTSSKTSSIKDFIGKLVMLEPFDLPGTVVAHGKDGSLGIEDFSSSSASVFHLVTGLDGRKNSVSLESGSLRGCYVYSDPELLADVKLECISRSRDSSYNEGASFTISDGISKYDPISFVAKGRSRNFVLQPLHSIRDENYVVYFDIQS
ncbi:uncharacterized protein LOC108202951 isoform X2 [Daucus carota subsp. sativus]|uniref:Alpha-L-arabinofuranosidase B arabinose-binding domain-containing protein n=1 Tax=Daucus carota subsp. sativus TaxID=79200 RepID=A0A175YFD4_DAUCS|nr:PREDICTED: uncharacterized protein LOC108202951 isoform X2 [Daucus carota subsp. sativus]